ncbi:hypothetical protein SAMD00019534_027740 [Acytostelium subglobosum LB1]|uniref:hypothetical protein n=1 Tax=Acytostelium subglobosum LB1 TaxID=1410327 RepID=UPI000644DFE3|nr:hypothetical protein SAMD00019534_027740 [Acytostelium subglobosum LB1]GAM19599.1 hypothetical protein SAMD00019534_027740 [Acytostelium subglobosum LB1]|eukprot:XP_012756361.1 hypothetical protein SAMD00019534_027740 [Acytostelium subglobosum LB1]
MSTKAQFEQAAEDVKKLTKSPSNEEKLKLYGLYKQATAGNNTASRPWAVQLEACAKHDAWTAEKDKACETCYQEYVDLVKVLQSKYA